VLKQTKTSAAENRKRKVDEIIRLRWKGCRAVQLESVRAGLAVLWRQRVPRLQSRFSQASSLRYNYGSPRTLSTRIKAG